MAFDAHPESSESAGFLSTTASVNTSHTSNVTGSKYPQLSTQERDDPAHSETAGHYWTSVWLHKYTLLAFAALFASIAAALIALWIADKAQDGFATTISDNHLAWTYGPTAILVVVISFWRQVDYHCKMMQPWQELRQGPADADRSLLLDYLSPIHITSFIRAFRCRHIPVAASIAGFAILKLVVLASTGLLTLTPVDINKTYPVNLTTAFDGVAFWDTVPDGNYAVNLNSSGKDTYKNISTHFVHSYLNALKDESTEPAGIANDMVFQSILPMLPTVSESEINSRKSELNLHTITAEVDAFVPDIQCEIAQPTINGLNNGERGPDITVQLDSATCSAGGDNQTTLGVTTRSPQCTGSCEEEQSLSKDCIGCAEWISYNFWRVNCSQESTIDYGSLVGASSLNDKNILDADLSYDFRFAMLVSNLTFAPTKDNDSAKIPSAHQTAAVICNIDYSMKSSLVTQNFLENTTQVDTTPGTETSLGNLTSAAFGEILFGGLLESQNVLEDLVISAPALATEPLYTLLLNTLNGQQSMDRFLESETLSSSASQVLAGLSAHFVRDNFLKPNDFVKSAAAVFVQDRLRIGAASLWTMVVGSILLSMLAIGIMLSRISDLLPHDPGYMSTDAVVLASSSRLQNLLKSCNSMRTSELTRFLQDIKFRTDVEKSFQITPTSDKLVGDFNERKPKTSVWIPLSATYLMILPTLGVPLVAIIALELLYRFSKENNGVVDVSGSEDVATYASRYTSALIVLLIATCFNGLDFTVASFAPYSSMRSGAVSASKGLNLQILGVLPPVALDQSLRARHASSFFSNVAGMVGSSLAIIASGLWTIDRAVVVGREGATASLATEWDLEWLNSSIYSDGGATKRFDQIQHGSALISPTIWNGVVLPEIADIRSMVAGSSAPASRDLSAQNYAFQTYGLRPLLNCKAVAEQYITIVDSKYPDDTTLNSLRVTAYPPLPSGCQSSGSTNSQDHHFTSERIFSLDDPNDTIVYMGDIHDLPIHPDRSTRGLQSDQDDGKRDRLPGISQNCPSVGIIFAKVSGKRPLRDDVTALVCTQKIENVYVNATYSGLDTRNPKIDPDTDPIVDEGSVRKITNQADGVDSFSYHIATYFNNTNSDSDTNITKFDYDSTVSLDPFLDHVAYGPTGTLPQDMFGKTNRGTLIQAIQRVYGRWMSLVIDMRSRNPMTEATRATLPEDQLLVHGTAYVTTSRLQLNEGSKLAMQVLLGAMFGFGCLAYALTNLRGTLPRKPTSIASRMALLAGSDLCDENKALIPPNAVWMRKKELEKVFDGWLFALGWWQQEEIRGSDYGEEVSTGCEGRSSGEKQASSRRFGIDVGVPDQLGFRETKWWALRRRLARRRSKA